MRGKQSGFTLVEIAIVLVIIGLLIGGVLKGQEMITQGRIKSAIIDFSGIAAAYYAYIDRYKALPGDDNQAPTRWGSSIMPTTAYGNGDGVITGPYYQTAVGTGTTNETANFWSHLRAAGLVTGDSLANPITLPVNSSGGIIGIQTGNGAATPGDVLQTSGTGTGIYGFMICSTRLPDRVAAAVDVQLDNGVPNSGSIRAWQSGGANDPVPATPAGPPYSDKGTPLSICRAL